MRAVMLLLSLSAFLPLGCAASVNPLASDRIIEFDEELLGTWVDAELSGEARTQDQVVILADGKGYRIEFSDLPEPKVVSAELVRLGDIRILDISYAAKPDDPPHYFVLVSESHGFLKLAHVDPRKLQKIVKENEPMLSIPKPTDKWPFLQIDWSTEQLQAFFARYGESVFVESEYREPLKKLAQGNN